MVQDDCVVFGEVIDSTLLKGAHIQAGASVRNCLIGEGAIIGKDAKLSNVIVGHRQVVPPGHIQSEGTF
jgi:glucose-1-phosphate adenylyltransferase